MNTDQGAWLLKLLLRITDSLSLCLLKGKSTMKTDGADA